MRDQNALRAGGTDVDVADVDRDAQEGRQFARRLCEEAAGAGVCRSETMLSQPRAASASDFASRTRPVSLSFTVACFRNAASARAP